MVNLEWTKPGRFSGPNAKVDPCTVHVLVRSIARYHAFLDLMSSAIMFFVPTIVRHSIPLIAYMVDWSIRTLTLAGTLISSTLRITVQLPWGYLVEHPIMMTRWKKVLLVMHTTSQLAHGKIASMSPTPFVAALLFHPAA